MSLSRGSVALLAALFLVRCGAPRPVASAANAWLEIDRGAFKSRVASVNRYPAGKSVNYDRTFTLKRDSTLANIPAGYSDGYPRAYTGALHVLIRGRRWPVVGRVTMNTIMADVTEDPEIRPGDEVVLFGRQGPAEITQAEFEERTGTIFADFYTAWGSSNPRILKPAPRAAQEADVVIRNGTVYDGSGSPGVAADVALRGDRIAAVGPGARGRVEIDAAGLAVAPGFINVLSWATESLLVDGRSLSDLKQGVTLEVFGEGWSMGPLNERMKREQKEQQGDLRYEIAWTTLGEYLEHLEGRGVSTNVASFVGATTVRIHEIGHEDRRPTAEELQRMCALVRRAMEEGALGVGSSLIYAPAFYADTAELIALSKAAAEHGGMYISHLRSEANRFEEAVDEILRIAREAGIRAEIYHLKAAGQANWPKMDRVIAKVEAARAAGLRITADMYTYTAGHTGLDAAMPPWVQEGGHRKWVERLKDPALRERVRREMSTPTDAWESLYLAAGSPEKVLLAGFKSEKLKPLTGKTLAEAARIRGKSPEETAMDLVVEDDSRVDTIYFLMSEENVRKQIRLPWVSFGSDAASMAPEGVFLKSRLHPRAYGNFARLLGKYVREEKVIPLSEAVRRLTSLPAENLGIRDRGAIRPGAFADLVVFDPRKIGDRATYEDPHRLAEGVAHVFVNGVQVLKDGQHTGARPGRVVRGPGWKGR
jgi:N-acyl-D-amino-acid deacylase